MKKQHLLISSILIISVLSSCNDKKKSEANQLIELIELRNQKQDQFDEFRSQVNEIRKSKSNLAKVISDLERKISLEKSDLVRVFQVPVDEELNKSIQEIERQHTVNMQAALTKFGKDPKAKEWVSRADKQDEYSALNTEYVGPVREKYEVQKKKTTDKAKQLVLEYKEKVETEVDAKYSNELNALKKQLTVAEEELVGKEVELSTFSGDISKLVQEIKRAKELKDTQ
ncbi:hypothetical protein OAB00_03130 [Akkermansiaceae bacterium]|nr:hypothetical protein [Akkermansiaceae bacterium]